MGSRRIEKAGVEAGYLPLVEAPLKWYSSEQTLRALKGPPCSGSPCKAGFHYCWCWIENGGEGVPRAGVPSGEGPGSVGATDGGWNREDWECSHSESLRSSGGGEGHTGAALGRRSLLVASCARTTLPTAARRAAPVGGRNGYDGAAERERAKNKYQ